jgi:hypothetical protein
MTSIMKKKYSLTLDDEFIQYCELNKITDIEKMAKQTFNRGFTILKYGESPPVIKEVKQEIKQQPVQEIKQPLQTPTKKTKDLYGE